MVQRLFHLCNFQHLRPSATVSTTAARELTCSHERPATSPKSLRFLEIVRKPFPQAGTTDTGICTERYRTVSLHSLKVLGRDPDPIAR